MSMRLQLFRIKEKLSITKKVHITQVQSTKMRIVYNVSLEVQFFVEPDEINLHIAWWAERCQKV